MICFSHQNIKILYQVVKIAECQHPCRYKCDLFHRLHSVNKRCPGTLGTRVPWLMYLQKVSGSQMFGYLSALHNNNCYHVEVLLFLCFKFSKCSVLLVVQHSSVSDIYLFNIGHALEILNSTLTFKRKNCQTEVVFPSARKLKLLLVW